MYVDVDYYNASHTALDATQYDLLLDSYKDKYIPGWMCLQHQVTTDRPPSMLQDLVGITQIQALISA